MFGITVEQVGSATRSLLLFGLGLVAVKFGLDAGTVASLAAAGAAIVVAIYGVWIKRSSAV